MGVGDRDVGDQEVGVLAACEGFACQGWDDVMDGARVLASQGSQAAAVEDFGRLLGGEGVPIGVAVDFDGERAVGGEGIVVFADSGGGRDGRVGHGYCRPVVGWSDFMRRLMWPSRSWISGMRDVAFSRDWRRCLRAAWRECA